jgi:hypothetical protein
MASNVREGLVAYLSNLAALAGIVDTRVYFGVLPQSALISLADGKGAISLYTIADTDEISHSGRSGLARTRFQASCWAKSYTDADAIARAVKPAVSAANAQGGGVGFGPCFFLGRRDLRDEQQNVFQIAIDFVVWHAE